MSDAGASFEVASGNGPAPAASGRAREQAVQAAFEGLLQIRRLMNSETTDPLVRPADWERGQVVRVVALVLEAAGIPPSARGASGERVATGYSVRAAEAHGVARVEWLGPAGSGAAHAEEAELHRCAAALRRLGWVVLEYRGPRRRRYLEVEAPGQGPGVE